MPKKIIPIILSFLLLFSGTLIGYNVSNYRWKSRNSIEENTKLRNFALYIYSEIKINFGSLKENDSEMQFVVGRIPFYKDLDIAILEKENIKKRSEYMNNEVILQVKDKLLDIEKEHNVKVLYAIESGSRAWGFESADSDYDIRFIYCHKKDWYVSIFPKRDVIEYPITDEYDYSGWDLQKALFLLNKSNPVLFEWLRSPIVYHQEEYFYEVMKEISQLYFSSISSIYHYLHMARRNNREFLQGENVKIKKYFYVLRPILACLWIDQFKEAPPMEFNKLLELIDNKELLLNIHYLLEKKRSGVELGLEPRIDIINNYINEKINYIGTLITGYASEKKRFLIFRSVLCKNIELLSCKKNVT
ncbi:nucleotidyltransferase domain-containing protein [Brucepastera parasyntrophica]|uniref:nucleotidyltransferase domain-containing protein n=1 Tax=Brucepastera parasyntrophica TaxID=2880008 RepID=UPI00210C4A57|nr:nucleotidyltransferase domain-containing protein [Brucepastera parasyntrophica]ULQ60327.1 nucleotidyltransferase domain-containing protein [Brucepastera parasyntrophica]